jgi:hypothetical protein
VLTHLGGSVPPPVPQDQVAAVTRCRTPNKQGSRQDLQLGRPGEGFFLPGRATRTTDFCSFRALRTRWRRRLRRKSPRVRVCGSTRSLKRDPPGGRTTGSPAGASVIASCGAARGSEASTAPDCASFLAAATPDLEGRPAGGGPRAGCAGRPLVRCAPPGAAPLAAARGTNARWTGITACGPGDGGTDADVSTTSLHCRPLPR